jgi:hypothetical protein
MSVTSAEDNITAIIDLLENAAASEWTPETPAVREYWADTQQERGPGAGQPPVLYVWSPTGSTLEQFSVDGTRFDQTDTVEVQCWSLDPTVSEQLMRDVVEILSGYLDDNQTDTPYSTVRPTTESDFREQKAARRTDHYITTVEVETRGLESTGVA